MEFIDKNHITGEMSDALFLEEIEKIAREREKRRDYGRDGYIKIYSETFEYKSLPYVIIIYRYFTLNRSIEETEFIPSSNNKFGRLSYPKELEKLVRLINEMMSLINDYYDNSFLNEGDLHSNQETWTLKQMIEWLHETAKTQIDMLDNLKVEFQKRIKAKTKLFNKDLKKFNIEIQKLIKKEKEAK